MPWFVGKLALLREEVSEEGRQHSGRHGVIHGRDASTGCLLIRFDSDEFGDNSPNALSRCSQIEPSHVRIYRTFTADSREQSGSAAMIGSDIWARVLSYIHIGTWPALAVAAPVLYTAADLAAITQPYDGSKFVTVGALTTTTAMYLGRSSVTALDISISAGLSPLFDFLPLTLHHLVLRSQSPAAIGHFTTLPHLLHLDITYATTEHRAQLLECSMPRLRELRAGLPLDYEDPPVHEYLFDSMLAFEHLEALDIGYLRTREGVHEGFWQPLFTQRNIVRLDFTRVMQWVNFNAALTCITDNLQLEALAIAGLRVNQDVFIRFCQTCPVKHLRCHHCYTDINSGMFAPVYTMFPLEFADFASSIYILRKHDVLNIKRWLEVQRPRKFIFTGLVEIEDHEAMLAARELTAAFSDVHDLLIGTHDPNYKEPFETVDGEPLDESDWRRHDQSCWGANTRFFDVIGSFNGHSETDDVRL
eukprot:TRINITY_DN47950_c0_g1_i1.p1 TRINITY_DN47950_c0_g1~~TRINITY_DN47950_c0_g1_i1.p1  ORF type:complete len:475 (-),score=42.71 TRINITY_DN47950_c0_g1_i1:244-1668(-)